MPEIAKIGECPASEGPLPQRISDPAAKRALDRDDSRRLTGQDRFRDHRHAVSRHVDFVALSKQCSETRKIFDNRLVIAGDERLEKLPGFLGSSGAGRDNDTAILLLGTKRLDRILERAVVELPMARRSSNSDEPSRARIIAQPLLFLFGQADALCRIADREKQLEPVRRRSARILRSCDLQIEVLELFPRIADVDELREAAALLANITSDGNAAVANANHNVGPGRLDQRAGFAGHNRKAGAQKGNAAQLIVADALRLAREAKGFAEGEQLVIVS